MFGLVKSDGVEMGVSWDQDAVSPDWERGPFLHLLQEESGPCYLLLEVAGLDAEWSQLCCFLGTQQQTYPHS